MQVLCLDNTLATVADQVPSVALSSNTSRVFSATNAEFSQVMFPSALDIAIVQLQNADARVREHQVEIISNRTGAFRR